MPSRYASAAYSLRRHGADLPVGRHPLQDFPYPVPEQRLHAVADRGAEHIGGPRPALNQLLDRVRPDEQFMDGNAAVKARPVALLAAETAEELNGVELGQTGRTVSRSVALEQVIVLFL